MDFIDLKTQYRRLKPSVDSRITKVLEHGQYILGPEVAELELVLAGYVGTKHCIAASSGTDPLLIALMAPWARLALQAALRASTVKRKPGVRVARVPRRAARRKA